LVLVGVFLPIAFICRKTWAYQNLTVKYGSMLVLVTAATWMVERIFNQKWLPF